MPKRSRPSTPSSPGAAGGRARIATPSPIPVTPERQSPVYASFGASAPSRPTRTVAATAPVDPLPPIVPAIPGAMPTPAGSAAPSPAPSSGPPTPTHGGRQGFKLRQPQYSMPTEGAARGSYFRDRGINFGPRKKKTPAQQLAFLQNFNRALRRARR
jgi:hypothetical protein